MCHIDKALRAESLSVMKRLNRMNRMFPHRCKRVIKTQNNQFFFFFNHQTEKEIVRETRLQDSCSLIIPTRIYITQAVWHQIPIQPRLRRSARCLRYRDGRPSGTNPASSVYTALSLISPGSPRLAWQTLSTYVILLFSLVTRGSF